MEKEREEKTERKRTKVNVSVCERTASLWLLGNGILFIVWMGLITPFSLFRSLSVGVDSFVIVVLVVSLFACLLLARLLQKFCCRCRRRKNTSAIVAPFLPVRSPSRPLFHLPCLRIVVVGSFALPPFVRPAHEHAVRSSARPSSRRQPSPPSLSYIHLTTPHTNVRRCHVMTPAILPSLLPPAAPDAPAAAAAPLVPAAVQPTPRPVFGAVPARFERRSGAGWGLRASRPVGGLVSCMGGLEGSVIVPSILISRPMQGH